MSAHHADQTSPDQTSHLIGQLFDAQVTKGTNNRTQQPAYSSQPAAVVIAALASTTRFHEPAKPLAGKQTWLNCLHASSTCIHRLCRHAWICCGNVSREGQRATTQRRGRMACPVQEPASSLSCCSSAAPTCSPTLPATFEPTVARQELLELCAGRSWALPTGAAGTLPCIHTPHLCCASQDCHFTPASCP